jgi:hypothetical protein
LWQIAVNTCPRTLAAQALLVRIWAIRKIHNEYTGKGFENLSVRHQFYTHVRLFCIENKKLFFYAILQGGGSSNDPPPPLHCSYTRQVESKIGLDDTCRFSERCNDYNSLIIILVHNVPWRIENKLRGECSYHTPLRVVLSNKKLSNWVRCRNAAGTSYTAVNGGTFIIALTGRQSPENCVTLLREFYNEMQYKRVNWSSQSKRSQPKKWSSRRKQTRTGETG